MIFYTTLNEIRGACTQALHCAIGTRPIQSAWVDAAVSAAGYVDHTGVTVASADSVAAAVHSVIQIEGLVADLRDGLLLDLLARVEQLELAVL